MAEQDRPRDLPGLLADIEGLLAELEACDPDIRDRVFALLDGVDTLHRLALTRLGDLLGGEELARLASRDDAVAWLLDAYGLREDPRQAAERALGEIRPYIHSHGGEVEVLDVAEGVVRVRMSGACAGCTASSVTLQRGVEEALREGMAGFAGLEVVEEPAAPHPPPGQTLLQIERRPPS